MGKRRVKKKIDKQTAASSPVPNVDAAYDPQVVDGEVPIIDQEVERQCAAIRAIRDVEIEHLRTRIRLLRSYFSEEHLQTPALQFFKENLPNVSVVKVDDSGLFELQWNDKKYSLSINNVADGTDLHASLYRWQE
ncbi:hypothetical protein K2173_015496 [Erythroxylum novogranatense]|uniref:Uncharacterized protein n=1 Tax=Erythroxylum novogranatense TaxID=1862640 RepID=A0AAV8SSK0_9ROSI|nr:hypothetical protein K2173_015496 [Erythroxylum novogranatense]